MTTALVLTARCDVPAAVPEMMQLANFLSNSTMMPKHLQGEPASLLAVMYKALALDIPLATAWENVIVQDGKTGLTTALMQGLVLRAGYELFLAHADNEQATVRAARPGIGPNREGETLTTFTLEDAQRAELIKIRDGKILARSAKGYAMTWEKYTPDMLVARAISRAARRFFPDILMGMTHTAEELGAEVDGDGAVVRANATRVDTVPQEVKNYILKIQGAKTIDELKALYNELLELEMLGAVTPQGHTLTQLISRVKDALTAEERKTARATKKAAATAPKSSTQVVSAEVVENPESDPGFEDLPAPPVEADPDTEDTPRRRAVLDYLGQHFGNPDIETHAVAHFGRPLDTISTENLGVWLLTIRDKKAPDQ